MDLVQEMLGAIEIPFVTDESLFSFRKFIRRFMRRFMRKENLLQNG